MESGVPALGVDVSATAVRLARRSGAPALHRDVFAPLPGTGRWHTVLLANGVVGLGGDPLRVLRRAGELLRRGGRCVIDKQVPKGLAIHLILDNYATHKHAEVAAWLDKHPRFHLHFTPTSSSWLNQVERWFRELTDKALRRGVFGSVPELVAAIQEYIDAHNNDPKPYVWTATAESILAKVARARATLNTVN